MNKKVLLFLPQGFEEYEAAVFTDVIGWSRAFGTEPVDLVTTGLRKEINPIREWKSKFRIEIFNEINKKEKDIIKIYHQNMIRLYKY
jgi:4-methyl-5(b-hydroxyethyl)-thiazole monophosphate biosynthesis